MDISKFGKGCIRQGADIRNISFEQVMGSTIDLPLEYNVIDELGSIKVENQGGSSSCTGQATEKYTEIINWFDNKNIEAPTLWEDLSSKFIYSRIFLPGGGAYIKDAIKVVYDIGTPREEHDPSYENGNPPSESYMRIVNNSEKAILNAGLQRARTYAEIVHHGNADTIKQAIYQNRGVVTGITGSNPGWSNLFNGIVKPPQTTETTWGHAILLVGWKMIDGRLYWIFINSWGDGWGDRGYGYLDHQYFCDFGFNIFTLVDIPKEKLNELVMKWWLLPSGNQYVVNETTKWMFSLSTEKLIAKLKLTGEPTRIDKTEQQLEAEGYIIVNASTKEEFVEIVDRIKDIGNLS